MTFKKSNNSNLLKIIVLVAIIISIVVLKFSNDRLSVNENPKIASNYTQFNLNENSSSLRDSIVSFSLEYLGTPYVSASCNKDGFDCSGFVYFVFQQFNIEVPRSSIGFKNFGKEIPINSVKKGDVLVFLSPTKNVIGHVGIVTKANGMESEFIHATSGTDMKVVLTSLTNKGYTKRFVKAVSVL